MEGELKKHHLDQAKKILSKKFLVGFLDDAEESVKRMMNYFGWRYDEDETNQMVQHDCVQKRLMERTNRNPVEYEIPKRGSQAHALIAWQTQFDMKLYGKTMRCKLSNIVFASAIRLIHSVRLLLFRLCQGAVRDSDKVVWFQGAKERAEKERKGGGKAVV